MENKFMEAMAFRHACKIFDESKKISNEDMKTILEAGRLSPSAFGLEPWKFLVITNEDLKEKLKPICWDQPQITSCSHLVIILAAIEDIKVESGKVKEKFLRWGLSDEQLEFYMDIYPEHMQRALSSDDHCYDWSAKQSFIPLANMMGAAAYMGIDSCAIEGFEKDKVEEVLNLDTTKFQVAVVLPFGYRVNPQRDKIRVAFDEVVEWIK